jgi:PAS domain S-box-containing protein
MVKSSQQSDSISKTLPRSPQDRLPIDALFNQIPIFAGFADIDGNFIRVNQDLCDFVGYSESELLSLRFQDITHPEDLSRDLEMTQSYLLAKYQNFHSKNVIAIKMGIMFGLMSMFR